MRPWSSRSEGVLWRFFDVPTIEVERVETSYDEPGWDFACLHPDPSWISNGPVGPYKTLEAAIDDLTSAEAKSGR